MILRILRLSASVAVLAAVVPAAPALAQSYPSSGGYRWGPPLRSGEPPSGYVAQADEASRPAQPQQGQPMPLDGRHYGPAVIQAGPGEAPSGYIAPDGRRGPPREAEDGPAPRPPGVVSGPSAAPAGSGAATVAALPPEDQPEVGEPKQLPPHLQRQLVDYVTKEPPGTIIIDTPNTYLYLVLGDGKAMRYGIGVGREGFTWTGAERISRMAEWPDWHPPAEMIERQPYLPRFMAGGEGNPLGARALYLGKTLYRIHGTNQPSTIGSFVSSGCIRLTNRDIEDLYGRVQVGTRVVVLPGKPPATASAAPAGAAPGQGAGQGSGQGPGQAPVQGSIQAPAQGSQSQGYPPAPAGGYSSGAVAVSGPSSIPASPLPPAR